MDVPNDFINAVAQTFDCYLLTEISSFHPAFGIERAWRRAVLPELLSQKPQLFRVFPIECPRQWRERFRYEKMQYEYAIRHWRERYNQRFTRVMVAHFERKSQERNKKWIYGVHVPLKNWENTVERWKYHWHIFRYLPIEGNDRYQFREK